MKGKDITHIFWFNKLDRVTNVNVHTHLMGLILLKTASGLTKRRSFPVATFQDVMQPPNRYISASLLPITINQN